MSPDGNLRVDVCHVFDFGNTRTYNIFNICVQNKIK